MDKNELEALINTYAYDKCKQVYERCEEEYNALNKLYDALNEENEKLKYENKRLKMYNTSMKNKLEKQRMSNKNVDSESDCTRYRNQTVAIKKKLDDCRLILDKKDREIVSLKIEVYKLKELLKKKGGK